jgi:predicted AlkP superfamily phosphohydrolase/phosphomutase
VNDVDPTFAMATMVTLLIGLDSVRLALNRNYNYVLNNIAKEMSPSHNLGGGPVW